MKIWDHCSKIIDHSLNLWNYLRECTTLISQCILTLVNGSLSLMSLVSQNGHCRFHYYESGTVRFDITITWQLEIHIEWVWSTETDTIFYFKERTKIRVCSPEIWDRLPKIRDRSIIMRDHCTKLRDHSMKPKGPCSKYWNQGTLFNKSTKGSFFNDKGPFYKKKGIALKIF